MLSFKLPSRHSRRTFGAFIAAGLAAQLVTMAHTATPASAAVGPGEDRQKSTPTGWWYYHGIDEISVNTLLAGNSARPTDIKYEGSGKFTVTMVKNSGVYASSSKWWPALTAAQVKTKADENGMRPTVLQGYYTANGLRFATVMISNTGANYEPWSWYYGTPTYLSGKVTSSNRMVSFGRIQGTTYYTAVFGSNTGTDATGWWWYYGKSMDEAKSLAAAKGARIVDLDRNDDGSYNLIMYKASGIRWHVYTGYQSGALSAKVDQYGERLIDVTPYVSGGTKYFAALAAIRSIGSQAEQR